MNNTDEQNKEFDFIESLYDFYKKIFSKLENKDKSSLKSSTVELGRTKDEKEQLQEMCDEVDSYHEKIKELRESGMTPGKWLEKEIETELEKADPKVSKESKEEFKKFIFDQFGEDIEAQADALDEEFEQTVEIAKGGKS